MRKNTLRFVRYAPAFFLLLVCIAPHLTLAQQDGFVPLADIGSQSSKLGQLYVTQQGDLAGFINGLFKFGIAVGAIVAVLRLAYAGYLYMGQSDMWSHKGEAKTIIGDVVLGLILLLAIWLILNQINPDILNLKALRNIKPVEQTQSAPTSGATPDTPDATAQNPTCFETGLGCQ